MIKITTLILAVFSIWFLGLSIFPSKVLKIVSNQYQTQDDKKDIAFTVLREKCNICHATKKRTDIFTLENMDSLAVAIHKQVFIKKKMPKGRKVKLTEEEREMLEKWLSTTIKDFEALD